MTKRVIRTDLSPVANKRIAVVVSGNNCWNLIHFRKGLLYGLDQAGLRVVALASLDEHASDLESSGIEVRHVPIARSCLNPLADARLVLHYVRLLRELRPAAFCGFTIKPNVYGAIAAQIAGVPVINNITGMGSSFLTKGLVWRLVEQLYRFALRRSECVFFHNQDDLRQFLGRGIVRREQARTIPGSGVDLQRFVPTDEDHLLGHGGRPIFLFIGRLLRHKGIREFVEAARLLRHTLPQAKFQLLGNLDPGNPTSITETELRLWIDEGVIEYLGEHADVRPFIRACTAVVLPSYREGMSRALLEAAAMGKPLVGSDVPGIRELVGEGITGTLAAPCDGTSLAQAMDRIARMPEKQLRDCGVSARRRAEEAFGENIVVDAYLEVIDKILTKEVPC
jgi:glycosyltransferase involved in cell wall biosynthesis